MSCCQWISAIPTRCANAGNEALQLLELVDMNLHAHKLPAALSGGQQQRVAIARALANDPGLIIADEPTGNLDSKSANNIFHLFEQLSSEGKTVVMVTHDNSLAQRVHRTINIIDGEISQTNGALQTTSSMVKDAVSLSLYSSQDRGA
jgi:ABC-type lipoprotein export system ATPase subunit